MITFDGWSRYNIWDHSSIIMDLYTKRARCEAEEMTCAAQAAKLLSKLAKPGETVLDVGCATGYFYHSILSQQIPIDYFGIDATARFIHIGRSELPRFGLPEDRLQIARIDELTGSVDHVVCMNVLSNLDNFHRPLERILRLAHRSVILRESISNVARYQYVLDNYLNEQQQLRVFVNTYDRSELRRFANDLGFDTEEIMDQRTQGKPEMVIDYPHYWTFMIFRRRVTN